MQTARFVNGTEYLELADGPQFDFDNTFGFCGWLKPDSYAGSSPFINQIFGDENTGSGNTTLLVRLTSGNLEFVTAFGATYHVSTSGTAVPLGRWTHVAVSANGSTTSMFFDGRPVTVSGGNTQFPWQPAQAWRLGLTLDNLRPFTGGMYRIAAYARPITLQEILLHMLGGFPRDPTVFFELSEKPPRDLSRYKAPITMSGAISYYDGPAIPPVQQATVELPFAYEISTEKVDAATVYLDLQVTSADIASVSDLATVLLDLQAITTFEGVTRTDAATVLVDLVVLGGECYSRFHFTGEGEADTRWAATSVLTKWSVGAETRWTTTIEAQPGCH